MTLKASINFDLQIDVTELILITTARVCRDLLSDCRHLWGTAVERKRAAARKPGLQRNHKKPQKVQVCCIGPPCRGSYKMHKCRSAKYYTDNMY